MPYNYALEQLYIDQDGDLIHEPIAALISWLDPANQSYSHAFTLRVQHRSAYHDDQVTVSWDIQKLTATDAGLAHAVRRFRKGSTALMEAQTELAAYGLAFVAVSCLLHKRIVRFTRWCPPDLLFDVTPSHLRGVEVAGRATRGYTAFKQTLDGPPGTPKTPAKVGKRAQLLAQADVAEAYVSLWCRQPMVSIWEQVKP